MIPECSNPASFPVYSLDPFYWRGSEWTGKKTVPKKLDWEQLLQAPDVWVLATDLNSEPQFPLLWKRGNNTHIKALCEGYWCEECAGLWHVMFSVPSLLPSPWWHKLLSPKTLRNAESFYYKTKNFTCSFKWLSPEKQLITRHICSSFSCIYHI